MISQTLRISVFGVYVGEIKEFETANFLPIKPVISVLLTTSTKQMISTPFKGAIYFRLPDDICKKWELRVDSRKTHLTYFAYTHPSFSFFVAWTCRMMRKTRPTITKTQKTGIKIILNHPIPHPPIMQRSMPQRT